MFIDLSPIRRNKNFRNLFFGQMINGLGTQMTAITIPFQVYALTHSAFYTGLVSGVEFIFLLATGLIGGVYADTKEKRRLLLVSEVLLAALTLVLAANALMTNPSLPLIFIVAALSAGLSGLHRPALEALTPRLVDKDDLNKISAINPLRTILTAIIGPTIAGLLISNLGAFTTYLIDFASFAVSFFFLMRLPKVFPLQEAKDNAQSNPFRSIVDGFRYIRSRQELIGTYLIDFIAMVFCMPNALFPAIAEEVNRKSWVGLLYAAPSIGGLLISIFSRWTLKVHRHGRSIILAACFWSLSMAIVGHSFTFPVIVVGLILAGSFDMISGIFRMTMWNQTIPPSMRGRMASFEMISYSSGPLLGNALCGFMADWVGVHRALFYGGLVSLTLIILASLRLPIFWHYKAETTEPTPH